MGWGMAPSVSATDHKSKLYAKPVRNIMLYRTYMV